MYVTGYTRAWSGKTFAVLLRPVAEPRPPELRLDVEGTWSRNTIELREADRTLSEALNEPNENPRPDSPSAPWIAATLKRGTRADFDARCASLAR